VKNVDVIILGAGAAGMMCAIEAGARGRSVLILEKSNKVGKKILMSGGGRCNFTNLQVTPEQYISHNPHFCKSALRRYTPADFIAMVQRYRIAYYEKTKGQLFCEDKASLIVEMLVSECKKNNVNLQLNQAIVSVKKTNHHFIVQCQDEIYRGESLVIATGGLSIPTLGSSPFGYQVAAQFGLTVRPTRAGLVPLTLHVEDKERFESLAGISVDACVSCSGVSFEESILFTHRGLSGPAILQISSYWNPGDTLMLKLLPGLDLYALLLQERYASPDCHLKTILAKYVAKRLLAVFYSATDLDKRLKQFTDKQLLTMANLLQAWSIKPNGTEGYRTAEVTLGGVDCHQISSQRFEAVDVPGLFFIGEVLDVSGWLGGYNFQWAWSSGWAAGQVV
jgi:predicted Rossmann fold flavoprotein